jgi:hypothetical protein
MEEKVGVLTRVRWRAMPGAKQAVPGGVLVPAAGGILSGHRRPAV